MSSVDIHRLILPGERYLAEGWMERQGEMVTLILAERTLPTTRQNFWVWPDLDSKLTAKDLVETLWHIGIKATLAQPTYVDEAASGVMTSRTLNDLDSRDTVFTEDFAKKAISYQEPKIHWDRIDTALSLGGLLLFGLRASVPGFDASVPAELLPVLLWKLSPILALAPLGLRRILKDRYRRTHDNIFQLAAKKAVAESITVKRWEQIPRDYTSYFCYVRQVNGSRVLRISRNADFRMVLPGEELIADGTMRRVHGNICFLLDQERFNGRIPLNRSPDKIQKLLMKDGFPAIYKDFFLRSNAWLNVEEDTQDIVNGFREEGIGFGWRGLPLI